LVDSNPDDAPDAERRWSVVSAVCPHLAVDGRRGLRFPDQPKEQLEPLVDRRELILHHAAEHAPDAALVDGAQVVDERVGRLREAALPLRQLRVERALARCPGEGDDRDERGIAGPR
jgi:hypothetical protein